MNITGYHGKLPQRGDFVSGKLPETFKTTWDDWAQQLVTVSKVVAQQDSTVTWYRLPIYRFYLSSRIAGDNAWIGIMMPSSDSVGREFPFCLVHSIDPNCHAHQAFDLYQNYFHQIEQIVKDLFTGTLSFELLRDTLSSLDEKINTEISVSPIPIKPQVQEPAISIRLVNTEEDTGRAPRWDLATTTILNASCSAHSIWTTSPISKSTPETLICEALPSRSSSASMFNGHYDPSQWTQLTLSNEATEYREENDFGRTSATTIQTNVENSDTIPINKKTLAQPGKTDILEFDENDSLDTPWDD